MADANDRDDDPYDEGGDGDDTEGCHCEEWVSLGYGAWLILHTYPDGSASVMWATDLPGGIVQLGGMT